MPVASKEMVTAPLVSIITPTFDRRDVVGDTIRSVLSQTIENFEMVVVDDGSSDDTVGLVESFGDPRIRVYKQDNAGPGAARNRGIGLAKGEFLKFLDSDDLLTPTSLENQLGLIGKTAADFCYGPWVHSRIELGGLVKVRKGVMQQNPLPRHRSTHSAMIRGWTVILQASLFRSAGVRCIGGFRTDMLNYEDTEFLFRYLAVRPSCCHASDSLTLYREHDLGRLSQSAVSEEKRTHDSDQLMDAMSYTIERHNPIVDKFSRGLLDYQRAKRGRSQQKASIYQLGAALTHRVRNSLYRRATRSPWPSDYAVAPIRPTQIESIQALGFSNIVPLAW